MMMMIVIVFIIVFFFMLTALPIAAPTPMRAAGGTAFPQWYDEDALFRFRLRLATGADAAWPPSLSRPRPTRQ